MSVDALQLLFYAGFTVLGWWLRHQGVPMPAPGPTTPTPAPAIGQGALIELLKAFLDRLGQPPAPPPAPSAPNAAVFHVPIEVAAGAKPPAG